jgi:hypothetical protein
MLPQHFRSEGEIAAAILTGRELGIGPMTSLRSIHLIKGKVGLAADLQLALMIRAGAKISWAHDGSAGLAELHITRPGQATYVSRYTTDDARAAGILSDMYKKHPGPMLRARAISAAGRAYYPDVLAGVYTPEEIASIEVDGPRDQPASLPAPASPTVYETVCELLRAAQTHADIAYARAQIKARWEGPRPTQQQLDELGMLGDHATRRADAQHRGAQRDPCDAPQREPGDEGDGGP